MIFDWFNFFLSDLIVFDLEKSLTSSIAQFFIYSFAMAFVSLCGHLVQLPNVVFFASRLSRCVQERSRPNSAAKSIDKTGPQPLLSLHSTS